MSDRRYRPVTCKDNVGLPFPRSWFVVSVQRLNFNSVQCRLAVITNLDHQQCPEATFHLDHGI